MTISRWSFRQLGRVPACAGLFFFCSAAWADAHWEFSRKVDADHRIDPIASAAQFDWADDFGLEVVFRPEVTESYRTLVMKADRNAEPERVQYAVSLLDGHPEFKYKDASGEWFMYLAEEKACPPGKWYRLVVKVDGGRPRLWVNGRELKLKEPFQNPPRPVPLVRAGDPLLVGQGQKAAAEPGYFFVGEIRSLRLVSPPGKLAVPGDGDFQLMLDEYEARRREIGGDSSDYADSPEGAAIEADFIRLRGLAAASRYREFMEEAAKLDRSLEAWGPAVRASAARKERAGWFAGIASGADFGLTTLPAGSGFKREPGVFRILEPAAPVRLQAARGESEGFQLIPVAGESDTAVEIQFTGLRTADGKTLAPGAVRWGEVRDITAKETILGETPEERAGFVGSWPDLIIDENPAQVKIPKESEAPIFVRVSAPHDAEPGDYAGELIVRNRSGEKRLPLALRVLSFALPERNSLPVVFCFRPQFYQEWFGIDTLSAERKRYLYTFLNSYRVPPSNIYEPELYPSAADQKEFRLDFATSGYFLFNDPLPEAELEKLLDQFRPSLRNVEQAGLRDSVYCYSFDELSIGNADLIRRRTAAARQVLGKFKQEFPWLRRVQTSEPRAEMLDLFDIWCPLFDYCREDNDSYREFRRQGVKFWWYSADYPANPCPNFFLGYPLAAPRAIMSLTWQKRIDGILYWCINREWPVNRENKERFLTDSTVWLPAIAPYWDPESLVRRNGMGNLVYPGPEGKLYPSLRLENLRDGIEDYEYYRLLEKRLAELRRLNPASPLIAEAVALLTVPADVAKEVNDYSRDPRGMMRQHDRLGQMIERVNRELNRKQP